MNTLLVELRHRLSNELEAVRGEKRFQEDIKKDIKFVEDTLQDWKDMQIHLGNAERTHDLASTDQERHYTRQYLNSILERSNDLDKVVKILVNEMNSHYLLE